MTERFTTCCSPDWWTNLASKSSTTRQREKLTNMKGMKYCIFYTKYILYNKLYIHYQNNLFDYMMQFKVIFLKRPSLTYIHTSDWQQTKPTLDQLEKYDAFGGIYLSFNRKIKLMCYAHCLLPSLGNVKPKTLLRMSLNGRMQNKSENCCSLLEL